MLSGTLNSAVTAAAGMSAAVTRPPNHPPANPTACAVRSAGRLYDAVLTGSTRSP